MRPKKVILSVCDSENTLSIRKFFLETNGYRVLSVTNHEDAVKTFVENGVDLVIVEQIDKVPVAKMIEDLKEIRRYIPVVLLTEVERTQRQILLCDAMLWASKTSNEELLERLKVFVARKRGPNKGRIYGDKVVIVPEIQEVPA